MLESGCMLLLLRPSPQHRDAGADARPSSTPPATATMLALGRNWSVVRWGLYARLPLAPAPACGGGSKRPIAGRLCGDTRTHCRRG